MPKSTFIIFNGDKYETQEDAMEVCNYSTVTIDLENKEAVTIFNQMKFAFEQEAGHCIIEKEKHKDKFVSFQIEVLIPKVHNCINCGHDEIEHTACYEQGTEFWYECKECGHCWYVSGDQMYVSQEGTKQS